jgi:oligopeptide/dipeptide ABC transporter ATP-binding protein
VLRLAILAALVTLASLAETPALGASATKVKSWTFVVGNDGTVDSLNPYVGLTNPDYEAYGMIWDNLSDYAQTGDFGPTPRLATSWSVSKDKLTWTYHLRHGVRWSDGVPFTAADVAYTFQRDTTPNSTEFNNAANYVTNIDPKSIRVIDTYTVQMKVTQPTPEMATLEVYILPKHIWQHIPESKVSSYNPTTSVGTGPFVVSSFVPNQSITLKANPYYWGGKPGVKQVVFEPFANPSAEAFALRDVMIQAQVLKLIDGLVKETGVGMMMISHDLSVLGDVCDRVVVMYAGQIVEKGPANQVFNDAKHPYSDALAWAFPIIGDQDTRMHPRGLPGDPPDPSDVPSGCPFHPRCKVAEPYCANTDVKLWPAGEKRLAACVHVLPDHGRGLATEQAAETGEQVIA